MSRIDAFIAAWRSLGDREKRALYIAMILFYSGTAFGILLSVIVMAVIR